MIPLMLAMVVAILVPLVIMVGMALLCFPMVDNPVGGGGESSPFLTGCVEVDSTLGVLELGSRQGRRHQHQEQHARCGAGAGCSFTVVGDGCEVVVVMLVIFGARSSPGLVFVILVGQVKFDLLIP